jgi:hypothetical protein
MELNKIQSTAAKNALIIMNNKYEELVNEAIYVKSLKKKQYCN